ncbi:MAG: DUF488 domain-containing protein, partial [Acidobacteriota bacterium]|nr:DUF488 domain-containing protein [Acidobacteriota bacterium]
MTFDPPASTLERIFTVGHSNRTIEVFVSLLSAHGIACVADVRRHPGSRRWPHFSAAAMADSLRAHGIDY